MNFWTKLIKTRKEWDKIKIDLIKELCIDSFKDYISAIGITITYGFNNKEFVAFIPLSARWDINIIRDVLKKHVYVNKIEVCLINIDKNKSINSASIEYDNEKCKITTNIGSFEFSIPSKYEDIEKIASNTLFPKVDG